MIRKLLHIKKLKCGPAEVEFFGNVPLPDTTRSPASLEVAITRQAKEDAKRSRLSRKRILEELKHTLRRHERLLNGSFVSMPLHLLGLVAMVSYTLKGRLAIERLLPVGKKTPLFEGWAGLLSLYRRVAGLSYRIGDPSLLLQDHEARRTLRALASLCRKCGTYVTLYHRCHPHIEVTWDQQSLDLLMQEIEWFLNEGDVGSVVARIEILLSNAHRMLLSCAPTATVADAVAQLTEGELQSPPQKCDRQILLVEDEARVRDVLQIILESAGFAVALAADGEEALRLLLTKSYELIVTDVVMPGLSGTEVVRIARVLNGTQLSIGCSGYFSEDQMAHTFDQYYQKPMHLQSFQTSVSQLLNGTHEGKAHNNGTEPIR